MTFSAILIVASTPAGASLLAKNSRPPRSSSRPPSSLTIFASKLAPTVGCIPSGRAVGGRGGPAVGRAWFRRPARVDPTH
ncbi:hypothetical protein CQ048_01260 [Pseudomonas trivialis]|nr:hypothetical protein CQ048_01260 [Pseudomonas trivialis]PRB30455.1 hypothetical protein CQ041_01435 [Pseudomonas sp. MYb60]